MMLLAAKSISSLTVSYLPHYHLKHSDCKKLISLLSKLELKIFTAYKNRDKIKKWDDLCFLVLLPLSRVSMVAETKPLLIAFLA